jgi:hypothetical protein
LWDKYWGRLGKKGHLFSSSPLCDHPFQTSTHPSNSKHFIIEAQSSSSTRSITSVIFVGEEDRDLLLLEVDGVFGLPDSLPFREEDEEEEERKEGRGFFAGGKLCSSTKSSSSSSSSSSPSINLLHRLADEEDEEWDNGGERTKSSSFSSSSFSSFPFPLYL